MKSKILLDNFNRFHNYLRISLTERCNLRCNYCMPEKGVELSKESDLLSLDELYRLIKIFVNCGTNKIRLTGGEPTINKNLTNIIREIRKYDSIDTISITSNGLVLKNKVKELKEAGLTNFNISLDTLVEAKFNFYTKRQGLHRVIESINEILNLYGFVKVNCVVTKGFNDDEINDLVELTKDKNIDMRFIEFMPFDQNSKLTNIKINRLVKKKNDFSRGNYKYNKK